MTGLDPSEAAAAHRAIAKGSMAVFLDEPLAKRAYKLRNQLRDLFAGCGGRRSMPRRSRPQR